MRANLTLWLCLFAPLAGAQEQPPEQVFREQVNIVVAPTTVLDRDGNYVHGLEAKDFILYDKNIQQDIRVDVTFLPISLVIAVQSDAAMEGVLPRIQKIGPMFRDLVFGEHGEAAVISFSHEVRVLQDFTSDPDRLSEGLKKLRPLASTSRLVDAVNDAVRMLRRRPGNRRRVILLISESRDKGSEGRVRETLANAEFQNVSVYAVNVPRALTAVTQSTPVPRPNPVPPSARTAPAGAPMTPDTRDLGEYGNVMPAFEEIIRGVKSIFIANPVEVFTKYTGGKEYNFLTQKGLEEAVAAIGNELHSQYLISYTPNNKLDGGYHDIRVVVRGRPGLQVRTRPGYWMAAVPN